MKSPYLDLFLLCGITACFIAIIFGISFLVFRLHKRLRRMRLKKGFRETELLDDDLPLRRKRLVKIVAGSADKLEASYRDLFEKFERDYIDFDFLIHPDGFYVMIVRIETDQEGI